MFMIKRKGASSPEVMASTRSRQVPLSYEEDGQHRTRFEVKHYSAEGHTKAQVLQTSTLNHVNAVYETQDGICTNDERFEAYEENINLCHLLHTIRCGFVHRPRAATNTPETKQSTRLRLACLSMFVAEKEGGAAQVRTKHPHSSQPYITDADAFFLAQGRSDRRARSDFIQ